MTTPASPSAERGIPVAGGKAPGGSRLRRFLAIDAREPFIAHAQRPLGQLLMSLLALLAVAPHLGNWPSVLAVCAAMAAALLPGRRAAILFAATWVTALLGTALGENDTLDNIAAVLAQDQLTDLSSVALATGFLVLLFGAATGALYWVRRSPQSLLARRPLVTLLALETLLCGLASLDLMRGLPRVMLWAAIFVLTPYIWFLPHAVMDQRARAPSMLLQL
ncbi:MAG: hypothetical protein QFF03_24860, partial [Pseudomonadota bacterium]|nr:hypothetical protein [Pseudomonadota bacterium]